MIRKILFYSALALLMTFGALMAFDEPKPADNTLTVLLRAGQSIQIDLKKVVNGDVHEYGLARAALEFLTSKCLYGKNAEEVLNLLDPSRPIPPDSEIDFSKVDLAEQRNQQLEWAAELAQALANANRKRIKAINDQHHAKSIAEFDADPRFPH